MPDHLLSYEDSARSTCVASPHCRPAQDILRSLRLSPALSYRWAHLGPIGRKVTPLTLHGTTSVQNTGGGGGGRNCDIQAIGTWRQHRTYVGYSLDLFGLVERPAVQAQYVGSLGLWIVAATAYRRHDGPYVTWESRLDAPCDLGFHFSTARPRAADHDDAERCADLIFGRTVKVGRPSQRLSPAAVAVVEQAERLKDQYPELTYDAIAARLGLPVRRLRVWRADYRREHVGGQDGYLPLFYGGDGP